MIMMFKKKEKNGTAESPKKEKKKIDLMEYPKRFKRWAWGNGPPGKYGTEDNPFPANSYRARFKRWFYLQYRGYVYYITTMYDAPNDQYLYDLDIVPRKDVPDDAVHVTNEKKTYHLDLDHRKRGFDATLDNGFTAHDAYMYIRCTKIDEAMKIDLDGKPDVDYKKIALIVGAVFISFIVFYFMYMQR